MRFQRTSGQPIAGGRRSVAQLAGVVCVVGVAAVAAGAGLLVEMLAFGVALAVMAAVWRKPRLAVALALVVCVSLGLFLRAPLGSVGLVSVWPADAAFLALVVAAVVSHHRQRGSRRTATRMSWLVTGPLLAVLAFSILYLFVAGAYGYQTIGVAAREWVWYLAVPLFVSVMALDYDIVFSVRVVHALAVVMSLLVILSVAAPDIAPRLGDMVGSSVFGIPGSAPLLTRIFLPGGILVPTAFGMSIGKFVYRGSSRSTLPSIALITIYALGLVAGFGRGMWIWTVLALLLVFLSSGNARTALRLLVAASIVAGAILASNGIIGRTESMPHGLIALIGARISSVSLQTPDANTSIRFVEMADTVAQVSGHELFGLGLAAPVGHEYSGSSTPTYVVHNGYYAIFGRLGLVGLFAYLIFAVSVVVLGVRLLRGCPSQDKAIAFGALVGFVQGLLSSWTQDTNTALPGIVTMSLCAAILIACSAKMIAGGGLMLRDGDSHRRLPVSPPKWL